MHPPRAGDAAEPFQVAFSVSSQGPNQICVSQEVDATASVYRLVPCGALKTTTFAEEQDMRVSGLLVAPAVFVALLAGSSASAQTQPAPSAPPAPPTFATTKIEGTDNVYIFRYQGHQSMFVVTSDGVIATDPIGLGRPQAVTTYIEEIKKVTSQPIKYVIYSHNHYDHITGGKPFKDLGARFIAHKNAKRNSNGCSRPTS
jgi:hypothetical protein